MYFKLALRNVKKSFKDFLVYFLTLTFSVCLFYVFNSFQSQQAVMQMNKSQQIIVQQLSVIMTFLSVFVAIVLAFLILYANNFLIRRRKKELGLYTMLGMPRAKISRILVYETLTIGIISLASGMLLGLLVSQVLTVITANLFAVPIDYHFVFSISGTLMTVMAFALIFFITMIFNTFVLNRYKLIDLLNADRKNDDLKIKKIWLSVLLFLVSLGCLGWAYYKALHDGILAFNAIGPIIIAGSIGTVLFFLSLAGFLLTMVKSSKGLYFKNLNCFILRQINANINSNFISMSIVCIMLLLSIGALSTGLSLNNSMTKAIKNSTPYDYTVTAEYGLYPNGSRINDPKLQLEDSIKQLHLDQYIASSSFVNAYKSDLSMEDKNLMALVKDKTAKKLIHLNAESPVMAIPLSSYNAVRKQLGYEPIQLKDNEIYLYTGSEMVAGDISDIQKGTPEVTVFNHKVKVIDKSYEPISTGTTTAVANDYIMAITVPDRLIPEDAEKLRVSWNVTLKKGVKADTFDKKLHEQVTALSKDKNTENSFPAFTVATRQDVYNINKGMAVTFTYIGIYLGAVFLIASAVILALQQLSQASDNKKRYLVLHKIGADPKMINRSILLQIGIYFMMPLALAVVHSYVGIKMMNTVIVMFGKGDILTSSLFTAGIIILIYGSYFLVTYAGYKNILKS